MGKMTQYQAGREDGLDLALRIAKDGGLSALEEEVRFRNISGIHTAFAKKELEKASAMIKTTTMKTIFLLCVSVLHDEFDFGAKRCERFLDRANRISESLLANMASWADYEEMIAEEMGIEMVIDPEGKSMIRMRKADRNKKNNGPDVDMNKGKAGKDGKKEKV